MDYGKGANGAYLEKGESTGNYFFSHKTATGRRRALGSTAGQHADLR